MTKKEEILQNLDSSIEKIKNKEQRIVFMVPDTKGGGRASVSVIYRQALTLKNLGYEVAILNEKKDSISATSWLGSEYDVIPQYSVEENNLKIGAQDFLIVPEIFGNVFEQVEKMPMEKVIMVQSHEYLLDAFAPGKSFLDYGVSECITTNSTVANLINQTLSFNNINIIPIGIPEFFAPTEKLQKPVVAIHCRDARKAAKIIKTFYLKYPIYRFISFKDMHGLTEKNFADNLKESCLSVWIDDDASFGTFPVESIKCNVPVIGKIPNTIMGWMEDTNGIWVYDENQMVDLIAAFMKNWLEDNVPENLRNVSKSLEGRFTIEDANLHTEKVYGELFLKRIEKLEKIKSEVNRSA